MGQRIILSSAARTATNQSSPQQKTVVGSGAHFIINMTAVPGVDTVTFKIQGQDALGNWYDTGVTSAAIVATGIVVVKLGIGMAASVNVSYNDGLPDTYRVVATHSAGTSFTYTVCQNDIDNQ